MTAPRTEDRQKLRKDRAKKAVALAMQSRWTDAVVANESMLIDFPDDLEAYNRPLLLWQRTRMLSFPQ